MEQLFWGEKPSTPRPQRPWKPHPHLTRAPQLPPQPAPDPEMAPQIVPIPGTGPSFESQDPLSGRQPCSKNGQSHVQKHKDPA